MINEIPIISFKRGYYNKSLETFSKALMCVCVWGGGALKDGYQFEIYKSLLTKPLTDHCQHIINFSHIENKDTSFTEDFLLNGHDRNLYNKDIV